MAELSLRGKSAIVTGAGRGIGRAIALSLAEAGADVALAARTPSDLEHGASEIRALGSRAFAVPTDVSDSNQIESMVEATLKQFGNIDVLVNNAGINLRLPLVPLPDGSRAMISSTSYRTATGLDVGLAGLEPNLSVSFDWDAVTEQVDPVRSASQAALVGAGG